MVSLSSLRTFFLTILLVAPLLQSMNPAVSSLGLMVLYALVAAIIFISALRALVTDRIRVPRAYMWIVFWFAALIIWSLLRTEDSHGLELTLQWLGLLIFFSALVVWPLSAQELDRLIRVGGVAAILAVFLSVFGGIPLLGDVERIGRVAWFVYPNFLGGLLVIYAFFILLGLTSPEKLTKRLSAVALIVLVVGLASAASRAAMLTMLVIIFVVAMGHLSPRKRIYAALAFVGVLSLGMLCLALYVALGPQGLPRVGHLNWLMLDEYSVQLFGKHIDTGRWDLWVELLAYIEQRPVIGWGAGLSPETLTNNPLSSHNGYLQVWLQLGIVGMVLQVILLAALSLALLKGRNPVSRVALAVILGLMVREMFEVALLQNNTPLTLLTWLIAGIGLSARAAVTRKSLTVPAYGKPKAILVAVRR